MYVDESSYFSLAIPGVSIYLLGLFINLPYKTPKPLSTNNIEFDKRAGITLILAGVTASWLSRLIPGELGFLVYLLSQLRYIGVIYLIQSNWNLKLPLMILAFSGTLATAATYGMFHELLLWYSMLGGYWFVLKKRPASHKFLYIGIATFLVFFIQEIKTEYRESAKRGTILGFLNFVSEKDIVNNLDTKNLLTSTIVRMNQGWIVSRLMSHVPKEVDYAQGQTIKDAIYSAMVPRFLDPNKSRASGRENLNRYSGLNLSSNTSMGMSPLGEGYVNFGYYGAILTMLCLGTAFNLLYRTFANWSYENPYFLYAMPILFLQGIKIETEFLTVFNHVTKSCVLIIAVYFLLIKQMPSIFKPYPATTSI